MTTSGKILMVDDEPEIRGFVRRYLERDLYSVVEAANGQEALDRFRESPQLIILDIMMPGLDGFEVIRNVRQQSSVPILILTARGEEADMVAAFELGADDVLTKPFRPRELMARIKALLRRAKQLVGNAPVGPLHFEVSTRQAWSHGELLTLTPREYDLLRTLAANPGKNFTREELLTRVWGPEYLGDTRRVDVHISKVRDKLAQGGKPCPIRSIWGVGYRYEP